MWFRWRPICKLSKTMRALQPCGSRTVRLAIWLGAGLALSCAASAQSKTSFRNADEPAAAPTVGEATPPATAGYRIGAGDILSVVVRKEPDASADSIVVRSDGVITVPMVKEVPVAGLSPRELEKILTAKYARFIREPDVTVMVKEIHSQRVFVVGAVRKEGPLSLSTPLTVLQAIAAAGGLTDYAKKNKITILRVQDGKQIRIPFSYSAVINGSDPNRNLFLNPGDTIVVPQ